LRSQLSTIENHHTLMPATPTTDSRLFHALAFGLRWQSDLPLPPYTAAPANGADIAVSTLYAPLPHRDPLRTHGSITRFADGFRYTDKTSRSTIDVFGASRIEFRPGTSSSQLPLFFFGTITGLLLAWRGLIPIHGSAVELDGRGFLLCGPAGSGKSTTTAALLARGARLISDDLSVLYPIRPGQPPMLYAGRSTLRLHAETAAFLAEAVPCSAPAHIAAGKHVVSPPRVDAATPVPLAALLLLGNQPTHASATALLEAQFFRPFWTRRFLASTPQRRAQVSFAAHALHAQPAPPCIVRDRQSFHDCGDRLADLLRSLASA
jgi:hypothetical protein